MTQKLKLGLVFGGASSEYEVSLLSVSSVLANIDRTRYVIYRIGITKDGRMFYYTGEDSCIADDTWQDGRCVPCVLSPSREHHGFVILKERPEVVRLDCVFPVLHGKNGEDGTIQGLLTMAGIPFVGCGTLASAACVDKATTHTLLDKAGVLGAKWRAVTMHAYQKNQAAFLDEVEHALGFPCFVKPANAGSSVGITKAADRDMLASAMELAFRHDAKVVVEEMLYGKEIECAVLGNEEPVASCLGEIAPSNDFYDYNAKYIDGKTVTYVPARITEKESDEIRRIAVQAYQIMGCRGFARVDFFFSENGEIYLNEINTIPGFTSISMYPQLFVASGVPYSSLIDRLIEYAMAC